jgi:hypothetical protein
MEIVKIFKENKFRLLKIIGFVLLSIIALSFIVTLFGATFGNLRMGGGYGFTPGLSNNYYQKGYDLAESEAPSYGGVSDSQLSLRNISSTTPGENSATGADAEDYEVTSYSAEVRTRNLDYTCRIVSQLKTLEHVVFEWAEESDSYCNYSFKVEREKALEVFQKIQEPLKGRLKTLRVSEKYLKLNSSQLMRRLKAPSLRIMKLRPSQPTQEMLKHSRASLTVGFRLLNGLRRNGSLSAHNLIDFLALRQRRSTDSITLNFRYLL